MFRLTPEAQARVAESQEWLRVRQIDYANMSDESLVASTQYCMSQMEPRNYAPGEPVYDATMWHVILPELMRRVRRG